MKNILIYLTTFSLILTFTLLTVKETAAFSVLVQIDTDVFVSENYLGKAATNNTLEPKKIELDAEITTLWQEQKKTIPQPSFILPLKITSYFKNSLGEKEIASQKLKTDYAKLATFIETSLRPNLNNQEPQNAVWREENNRVVDFNPGSIGFSYDVFKISQALQEAILNNKEYLEVVPIQVYPEKSLADINNYGITGLVASGSSNFSGSSSNRIINIRVASSRYQGMLIPPGETFSFNEILGPVDGEHGFTPELVIKKDGLVPEFGGGICQVSTTVFRAALNAGLPIDQRRNHSFAVSYYSPQGTDATIYPGYQDLKFTNNTKSYLMVWPEIKGPLLTFNFFGKPDGRLVNVTYPVRYNFRSNGAFSASITRKIVLNEEIEEENFTSFYRPKEDFVQTDTEKDPVDENNKENNNSTDQDQLEENPIEENNINE